jgi:GGDEF domain-containing protein
MMIGDKDNRNERLTGLDTGANDFITSPIDAELVALRVRNALNRQNQENNTDPITGMPAGRGVQDALRQLVRDREGFWALLRFRILHLDQLQDAYSRQSSNDMLRATARLLAESLNKDAVEDDFLGYGGRNDFIIITQPDRVHKLKDDVERGFKEIVRTYYTADDLKRGYIKYKDEVSPMATLSVECVSPSDGPFYDIRSLSEALANR